jgi:transposase
MLAGDFFHVVEGMAAHREWLADNNYRAVLEVKCEAHVKEVAASYGASRQSVHAWLPGTRRTGWTACGEKSRRPHASPARLAADVEALVCEVRRVNPRWGVRRISFELA